jgi:regulation of enolase protein 1 (concanavalin A-like superfamily)
VHQAPAGDLENGSLMLLAHHTDATFGNVTVTPISSGPLQPKLTVTKQGQGNVTVTPNKPEYTLGETVQLTATPLDGWRFSHWTGDLSSSAAASSITMDANKSVHAVFVLQNPSVTSIQSDNFNAFSLNTNLWTFINPQGDGSVALNGQQALLTVPAGTEHDVWVYGNKAPRIMQPAPDTDFEVEVKFDSLVTQAYQMQGIIVEAGSGNYLRFDFHYDGSYTRLYAARFANYSPTVIADSIINPGGATSLYMRVKRTGNQWTQSYSFNGTTWTSAAPFNHTLQVREIGLFAGNAHGENSPAHTAIVDYFYNKELPLPSQKIWLPLISKGN